VHKSCVEAELIKKLKSGIAVESIRFLTIQEVAKMLRVEEATLRNWVAQRKIPYRKVGGAVRFLLEEILEWTKPDSSRAIGPKRNVRSRISATPAVALLGKG
jgi:excisionase family DNA binding protein